MPKMLTLMDYLTLVMSIFAGSSVVLLTGLNLYFKVRRKYPITVNCWFCNSNAKVPYECSNNWECPSCDQYNGFMPDGDYNKSIPAQHDEVLNNPISPKQDKNQTKKSKVGLCWKCNGNQELKIYQLASFTPINPLRYDQEIEVFRRKLEREYKLCGLCEGVVTRTLRKQHNWLLGLNYEQLQRKKLSLQKIIKPKVKSGCKWTSYYGPGVVHLLLVLCAAWMSLAYGVKANRENVTHITYILSVLPFSILPIIPLALKHELQVIGVALFAHVFAGLLIRHRGRVKQGSVVTLTLDATCFILWLCLQTFASLSQMETREWVLKQFDVEWMKSLDFNGYMEIISYLVLASQVAVALIPRPITHAVKKSKKKYTFERIHIKKQPVYSCGDEFSDGEDVVSEKGNLKGSQSMPANGSPKCTSNSQKELNTSQTFAEALKSPQVPSPSVNEEDILGINNLSLGPANAATRLRSGLKSSPKGMPRTKPVIQPARLNLKNIVQSSWVAGGYWQVPSSNQYTFSVPHHQGYPVSPQHSINSYFPYHTSPLSRSSSQSSGFVSNSGTASSVPPYNSSSLPGSASSSTCGDQETSSLFSEPAYHKFPPTSYYGNIFSGNHVPSYSSQHGHTLYGMLGTPLPMIPHYPNYFGRERLYNVNHCCCCQNSMTKVLHPANKKTTGEDSDCHSSSSSGFSDSPSCAKSTKVSEFPVYKVNNSKDKESKNAVHRPGSAIWTVMKENVFLLIVLSGSLMFNGIMFYLMLADKGSSLFAS